MAEFCLLTYRTCRRISHIRMHSSIGSSYLEIVVILMETFRNEKMEGPSMAGMHRAA
jgi:hypothetical protein